MAFIVAAKKKQRNNATRVSNIFHDSKRIIFICVWWARLVVCIHIDTNYQSYLSVTWNARISLQRKTLGHFTVGILISIKYAQNEHRNRFRFKCKTEKKQSVWPLKRLKRYDSTFFYQMEFPLRIFQTFLKVFHEKGIKCYTCAACCAAPCRAAKKGQITDQNILECYDISAFNFLVNHSRGNASNAEDYVGCVLHEWDDRVSIILMKTIAHETFHERVESNWQWH